MVSIKYYRRTLSNYMYIHLFWRVNKKSSGIVCLHPSFRVSARYMRRQGGIYIYESDVNINICIIILQESYVLISRQSYITVRGLKKVLYIALFNFDVIVTRVQHLHWIINYYYSFQFLYVIQWDIAMK